VKLIENIMNASNLKMSPAIEKGPKMGNEMKFQWLKDQTKLNERESLA